MNRRLAATAIRVAAIALFFATWQLIAEYGIISHLFLAGPAEAIASLFNRSTQSDIVLNAIPTFYQIGIAFGASCIIGLGVGLVVGAGKYLTKAFESIFLALFAVPKILLLPIFVLLWGLRPSAIIYFATFDGIFPILVNTIAGIKQVNPSYLTLAKSMGAKWTQVYRKVLLPSIVPQALAGVRLSLIIVSVEVTLAQEILGQNIGLGGYFYFLAETFHVGPLYAGILVFSLVLIAVNLLLLAAEKRLVSFRI